MNNLNSNLIQADSLSPISGDKISAILRERARILAETNIEKVSEENTFDVVEFQLANEIYGIEARFVREIYIFSHLRKIPGTPDFMLGVINLQGKIISLIDIKRIVGLDISSETSTKQKCLILSFKERELAILIDAVIGIKSETTSEISKGFIAEKNAQDNYISAITSSNTIILDAMRILNDQKLTINIS